LPGGFRITAVLQRLPLRLQLTLPYVVLLLALAALVGWLSYHAADSAIDDMAARLHLSTSARIEESTAAYLSNWQYVLDAARGDDVRSLPAVERRLWDASALSSVRPSYVYFAAPDGRFVGVQRADEGRAVLKLREQPGLRARELFASSQPGDRAQPQGEEPDVYVAVTRPWYETAAATRGDTWSAPYLDYSTAAPIVTLARALRDDAGTLLGVYGADVPLAQLDTFMRRLQIVQQGLAFIVTNDGRVIASSLPATADDPGPLHSAATHRHADVAASFRAVAGQTQRDANGGPNPLRWIDTEAGTMLVSATLLAQHPSLNWWIVVAQRKDALTAGITRNAFRTALLAGLASLAALLLGTLVLRSLLGEVRALTRATEQLSADRSPAPLATRRRDELGRLSNAFDRMVARLDSTEQQLRGVTEAMSEGLFVVDAQWHITYANPVTETYGRKPVGDVLGRVLWEAFPSILGTDLETALRETAASREPRTLETWRELSQRWVEARMFPSPTGMAVFMTDVTQRHRSQAALAERQRELQRLAGELLTTQNEERRAIARELHDEMGQQLAALRINLQGLRAQAADDAERSRLDDSLSIVTEVIAQVRNRALDLHPSILDDLGLAAALQWMCERKAQRFGVPIVLQETSPLPPIDGRTGLACYRIAQEALLNALKHAKPQRIDVGVGVDADGRHLHMSIADDGVGFETRATAGQSLGLIGMRERAQQLGGVLTVQSLHNRGTRVDVSIPLQAA
jgi:signal transduction histidine kinase